MHIFYISLVLVLVAILIYKNREYKHLKFIYERTSLINDTMMNISEELSSFKDIDSLYKQLLEETIKIIVGAEVGSILVYNKEKDLMEYRAVCGFDMELLQNIKLKKEELFLYESTELRRPDIIKDPGKFDSLNIDHEKYSLLKDSQALEIKSTLSAPIYVNGEFFGIINIDNSSDVNAFSKKDIRLITYICRQLEGAIKNVFLVNELVEALRIDKLTGICNRRHLEEILERIISSSRLTELCVVMIDLDDFKYINDNYGHKVGDEVLKYFSDVLKSNMGEYDIASRYAGDEFVIVVNDSYENTKRMMDNIRDYLAKHPYKGIKSEFSSGICRVEKGMDMDKILTIADDRMYDEKRHRKGLNICSC